MSLGKENMFTTQWSSRKSCCFVDAVEFLGVSYQTFRLANAIKKGLNNFFGPLPTKGSSLPHPKEKHYQLTEGMRLKNTTY